MTKAFYTDLEFCLNVSDAKKATRIGPVFIIDEGVPTHVLLTVEHYQQLLQKQQTIVDLLAMPDVENVEFDAPMLLNPKFKPADLQ